MVAKPEGLIIPIVTPFTTDYTLDEKGLREEIRFLLDYHINGLLVNGSTGEFTSLSIEERRRIIEIVSEECKRKVFIIAGVETPATQDAIDEAKRVKQAGADFALVATPFYLKPTIDGVYEHYKRVAETGVPTLLYNNPFRTYVNLSTSLVSKLAELKNVVGIKQSNVDLSQTTEYIEVIGDKISVIHSYGDAVSVFPGLLLGGAGVMNITFLVAPDRVMQLYEATRSRDVETAKKIWVEILSLLRNIGGGVHGEPNPAPLKEALRIVGKPAGPARLPVLPVTNDTSELLRKILKNLKLAR